MKERSRRLRGWIIIEDTIRVTCVTLVFGKLYERNVQERNIRWRIVLLVIRLSERFSSLMLFLIVFT